MRNLVVFLNARKYHTFYEGRGSWHVRHIPTYGWVCGRRTPDGGKDLRRAHCKWRTYQQVKVVVLHVVASLRAIRQDSQGMQNLLQPANHH